MTLLEKLSTGPLNLESAPLHAVWLYLRSLEPIEHEVPASTLTGAAVNGAGTERGEALFWVFCQVCHGEGGSGSPFITVALKDAAEAMDEAMLSKFISDGLPGTAMPGFGETLTGEEIADLIAFFRTWQECLLQVDRSLRNAYL